jgi:hypothetical protein
MLLEEKDYYSEHAGVKLRAILGLGHCAARYCF